MADRFWPGASPIDQRMTVNWQGRWRTMQVVGVVGRLRHDGLDSDPRPEVFIPFAQLPYGSMTFVVRTTTDAASLIPMLKTTNLGRRPHAAAVPDIDDRRTGGPVAGAASLHHQSPRVLAALAFVLATIGIYGIVSFATAQRTREIGVRVVVGGSGRDILRLVFAEGAQTSRSGSPRRVGRIAGGHASRRRAPVSGIADRSADARRRRRPC